MITKDDKVDFVFHEEIFPPEKGEYMVVCINNWGQSRAVDCFLVKKMADNEAQDRSIRAKRYGIPSRFRVCPRSDGSVVALKKQ